MVTGGPGKPAKRGKKGMMQAGGEEGMMEGKAGANIEDGREGKVGEEEGKMEGKVTEGNGAGKIEGEVDMVGPSTEDGGDGVEGGDGLGGMVMNLDPTATGGEFQPASEEAIIMALQLEAEGNTVFTHTQEGCADGDCYHNAIPKFNLMSHDQDPLEGAKRRRRLSGEESPPLVKGRGDLESGIISGLNGRIESFMTQLETYIKNGKGQSRADKKIYQHHCSDCYISGNQYIEEKSRARY